MKPQWLHLKYQLQIFKEGSFGGVPTTYYDLFRVENGFIAEHWDVMETLAAKETWQNQNGKF